ncbi:hypothetical protein RS030_182692 [Cryptosporidium xiaoi]|uniref:Uncharacterized protein n=1 Tax=Cryptosporidium xiaoi TaxID=659607 RepID=A0AAV9Y1N2_9CRYT
MKFQMNNSENIMNNQVDKKVKIVKHSSNLKGVLPTLETADSLDRTVNVPYLPQQEQGANGNITPKRSLKNNDMSNCFEAHPSVINSIDRTTAPSSELNSHFRYDISTSVSNLSPNINGYQTPSNRLNKKRNTSCIYNETQINKFESNNLGQVKNYYLGNNNFNSITGVGFSNANSNVGNINTSHIANSDLGANPSLNFNVNSNANNPQINAPILLSAVLQVIASLQRLKNNASQNNGNSNARIDHPGYNDISSVNNTTNVSTASQILGTKLPGVHPTIAALALAYSLYVAASNQVQSKDANNGSIINNLNINSEELLQNLNQLIYERIHSLNLNAKLNNSSGQNNDTRSKSKSNEANNNKLYHGNYNVKNEINNNAYNLNLPPMDFILTETRTENDAGLNNEVRINNYTGVDLFEYSSYSEDDYENSIKGYFDNLHSHKMESDPIKLETSNNCIWDDLAYNSFLESVDFDTAYSRKHAFIRNELLFKHKPVIEIERENCDSRNKSTSNKFNNIGDQTLNNRLYSICDDFLVKNSEEKNPINSINSLLKIVSGFNNVNNKSGNNTNNNS